MLFLILIAQLILGSGCTPNPTREPETVPARQVMQSQVSHPDTPSVMEDTLKLTLADLLGQIDQSKDARFVRIEDQYTNKPGIYLRKETYEAFLQMHKAAQKDGIHLLIVSATRNFNYQKNIWENKWAGNWEVEGKNLATAFPDPVQRAKTILRYSAMPGTSRHHWGTDIDLNNLSNSHFTTGKGKAIYDWLQAHAADFGFCQTYTAKGDLRPDGYEEEKWHWSYTPIAKEYLKAYDQLVTAEKIKGFLGSETAEEIQVIQKYVLGINPGCK
ncbi:MAG: M15 family metallopeptidase [Bacteroidia bacterium]|nr:M15 family metallopeptidase [Bacteroidia bacterium]